MFSPRWGEAGDADGGNAEEVATEFPEIAESELLNQVAVAEHGQRPGEVDRAIVTKAEFIQ